MSDFLAKLVLSIVKANPDKVEQARERPELAGWFVGKVMKAVQGHANPDEVRGLVESELRARALGGEAR